ncbi:ankyrin repeat domain-containing protein [Ottowia thiooxydans]|uniref:Ankyrin repeat protein n=1 Tax=Ottowia thiooxydans TaxID=219182 RepID=A0ABV2QIX6_9BURK
MFCCRKSRYAVLSDSPPRPLLKLNQSSAQPLLKKVEDYGARDIVVGNTNVGEFLFQEKAQKGQTGKTSEADGLLDSPPLFSNDDNPEHIKNQLQRGADANQVGRAGITPLIHAVILGNIGNARVLLDHGVDIDATDHSKNTALTHAIVARRETLVHLLLARGANIEGTVQNSVVTPLRMALRFSPSIAKTLLAHGANTETPNSTGETPLVFTCYLGEFSAFNALVENQANLETKDSLGRTPLTLAVIDNRLDMAELLLSNGAEINAIDKNGNTPLTLAIDKGHLELAKMLLARRANVQYSGDGTSFWLLLRASKQDDPSLLNAVLRATAYSSENSLPPSLLYHLFPSSTVFDDAAVRALRRDDHIGILDVLYFQGRLTGIPYTPLFSFIFMFDPHPNAPGSVQNNLDKALFNAAKGGAVQIALDAIASGANLKAVDMTTRLTPLEIAASNGCLNVVTALAPLLQTEHDDALIAGANSRYVNLALIAAAKAGHMNVVHQLLVMGADPLAADEDGVSAFQHANMSGNLDFETTMMLLAERPSLA